MTSVKSLFRKPPISIPSNGYSTGIIRIGHTGHCILTTWFLTQLTPAVSTHIALYPHPSTDSF
nr:hypothetical protein [Nitrosomonas sp.]